MILKCPLNTFFWSPPYVTGGKWDGTRSKGKLMGANYEGCSIQTTVFSCSEKKIAQCSLTVLYSMFCLKRQHLHPCHPQLNAPLRHDQNKFGHAKPHMHPPPSSPLTCHPRNRQVIWLITNRFSPLLLRRHVCEPRTSLNEIFPVALFEKNRFFPTW